jgi:surfactin synthase thioesterase subunit
VSRNPWLIPGAAPPAAPLRLYCFPYAGGSAAVFHAWRAALAPDIAVVAVQPPSRAERLLESPITRLEPMVDALVQAIAPPPGQRFAYFGHSLGGLLAFELARQQQRLGLPTPEHVIVSGCDAPRHRKPNRALHLLDDQALIDVLRGYNGTPPEILAHRELMALMLPTVRADFAISETYVYRDDVVLQRPITVLAGEHDERVGPQAVDAWRLETSARCDIHWFDGDHFFIHPHRDAVVDRVRRSLARPVPTAAPVAA